LGYHFVKKSPIKIKIFQPNPQEIIEKMYFPIEVNKDAVVEKVWRIGGENGWYFGTKLWKIRGLLDQLTGGIGFRKGRISATELKKGDPIDFWKVCQADKREGILELEAEMNLPGKVFLEWKIGYNELIQTVRFYPEGKWGRYYWKIVKPVHRWIFLNMGKEIAKG